MQQLLKQFRRWFVYLWARPSLKESTTLLSGGPYMVTTKAGWLLNYVASSEDAELYYLYDSYTQPLPWGEDDAFYPPGTRSPFDHRICRLYISKEKTFDQPMETFMEPKIGVTVEQFDPRKFTTISELKIIRITGKDGIPFIRIWLVSPRSSFLFEMYVGSHPPSEVAEEFFKIIKTLRLNPNDPSYHQLVA